MVEISNAEDATWKMKGRPFFYTNKIEANGNNAILFLWNEWSNI